MPYPRDDGILPLEHFVDNVGEDSAGRGRDGRRGNDLSRGLRAPGRRLSEHHLDPHPTYALDSEAHRAALDALLKPLV